MPEVDSTAVAQWNLKAVESGDLDAVRFEIVPRGYRPEQVEEVLDAIARLSAPGGRKNSQVDTPLAGES